MFKNERLNRIISVLQHKKRMGTSELEQELYVSSSTLRRDLIELEKMDKVRRGFGYVELVKPDNLELPYLFRGQEREQEKRQIAATASIFLSDNQAIFIDSSSTASFLAPYLVAGDLGCGFWPNFSHFIVDLIMQATLFDHNRNWYRKKLKEEVDICQCNRAIHRYHQGLSRSGVH